MGPSGRVFGDFPHLWSSGRRFDSWKDQSQKLGRKYSPVDAVPFYGNSHTGKGQPLITHAYNQKISPRDYLSSKQIWIFEWLKLSFLGNPELLHNFTTQFWSDFQPLKRVKFKNILHSKVYRKKYHKNPGLQTTIRRSIKQNLES